MQLQAIVKIQTKSCFPTQSYTYVVMYRTSVFWKYVISDLWLIPTH